MKVKWVRSWLAVSRIPEPTDVRELAKVFRSIVSLSTPVEHAYRGLAPGLLEQAGLHLYMLPVPVYQAPTLLDLAKAVRWVLEAPKPCLIYSWRGCCRAATLATAVLAVAEQQPLLPALADIVQALGCSISSLPQRSVLEAFTTLARNVGLERLVEELGSVGDTYRGSAAVEYAVLLSRGLGVSILEAYECTLGMLGLEKKCVSKEARAVATVAAKLAQRLGYIIAGIHVRLRGDHVDVRITTWIPRCHHPQKAQGPTLDEEELRRMIEEELGSLGLTVGIELESYEPASVPPPGT